MQSEWQRVGDKASSTVYFYEWVYRSVYVGGNEPNWELVAGKLGKCIWKVGMIQRAISKYFKVEHKGSATATCNVFKMGISDGWKENASSILQTLLWYCWY